MVPASGQVLAWGPAEVEREEEGEGRAAGGRILSILHYFLSHFFSRSLSVLSRLLSLTVVRRVHDDRVVGQAHLFQRVQQAADELGVGDHHVRVLRHPPPRQAALVGRGVRAEVHVRRVDPHVEGVARRDGALDEVDGLVRALDVDRLHPLLGQRARVLHPPVGKGVHDAPGPKLLFEFRKVGVGGVVLVLGLLLRVQVVEVAKKLVHAVVGGQEAVFVTGECGRVGGQGGGKSEKEAKTLPPRLPSSSSPVQVAQMVLPELARRVALSLHGLRHGRVVLGQAQLGARHADLRQAGPVRVLARDERGPARRARLLAVVVGELDALLGDAVDLRGVVAHQALRVGGHVGDAWRKKQRQNKSEKNADESVAARERGRAVHSVDARHTSTGSRVRAASIIPSPHPNRGREDDG